MICMIELAVEHSACQVYAGVPLHRERSPRCLQTSALVRHRPTGRPRRLEHRGQLGQSGNEVEIDLSTCSPDDQEGRKTLQRAITAATDQLTILQFEHGQD